MTRYDCSNFPTRTTRRDFLGGAAATALTTSLLPKVVRAEMQATFRYKKIPSTGERLPAVGLGSWITFNVGDNAQALARSTSVIRAFFEAGGRMIDSSPMYGSSQNTIGHVLDETEPGDQLFSAEKVWTRRSDQRPHQIASSFDYWRQPSFDLLQVHNLLSWETHLPALLAMKRDGNLRYVGVTTSHGRRHESLEQIMKTQPIDFVQLTYNIQDRAVENRLLPLAHERGIAVIANRPYGGGALVRSAKRYQLPAWAPDAGMNNWAQFLLKFIVSHPALTCTIPATTQVSHVRENMSACEGMMPDEKTRQRMVNVFQSL